MAGNSVARESGNAAHTRSCGLACGLAGMRGDEPGPVMPAGTMAASPSLARRSLLLVVLGLSSLCEQVLGAAPQTLPMIRLGPALVLAGLLLCKPGETGVFAIMALAIDMLVMALAPNGAMGAATIAWHAGCTVGMALLAAWYLRPRKPALAGPLGLRTLLDLSITAMVMSAPIGITDAMLAHRGHDLRTAHLLFSYIGPGVLGVVTLVPLMMMRPVDTAHWRLAHLPRLLLPAVPSALVVLSFVWPTPVMAVLMPVAMVIVTLGMNLRQTLVSMAAAAIAATCTAAMGGDGLVPPLMPEMLDAIRLRWLSWMAGQITLSTAINAAYAAAAAARKAHAGDKAMLRALPQLATFRADRAGCWTWVSPGWSALTGTQAQEADGQPMAAWIAPAQRPVLARALERIGQGEAQSLTLRLTLAQTRSDSAAERPPRKIDLALAAMHDDAGVLTGFAGTLRDITASSARLAAATAAEASWHELCDAAPVAIVRSDAQGVITYANWAAELTALAGQKQLLGRPLRAWLADDPAFDHATLARQLGTPGAQVRHELDIGTPAKSQWVGVVVTATFDADLRRMGYVLAVTDINARKRLEVELIEARRQSEPPVAVTSGVSAPF